MAHIVKALPYHRSPARAARHVAYIAHGEKDSPGAEKRELYGLGDRYKQVSKSIRNPEERRLALGRLLMEDARRVPRPTFHAHVFTLDTAAANRFAAMDRAVAEQRLRYCLGQTFNASAMGRRLQGMYAIHWDGGQGRAAHPHLHVIYSPTQTNGRPIYIGPRQLAQLKAGWNRAVERTLTPKPTRPRGRVSVPTRPLQQGIKAVRAAGKLRGFVRSPGRATMGAVRNAVVSSIFRASAAGRSRAAGRPEAKAASIVLRAGSLAVRLALGKLSIPREVVRVAFRATLDLGRNR